MRVIDARNPDGEFVVAVAACKECGAEIERWCIPLEVDGKCYPPQYLWRHGDGVVICGWEQGPQIAAPAEGTVVTL